MISIELTHGYRTIVDSLDEKIARAHRWHTQVKRHTCYARRNTSNGSLYLHREILRAAPDMVVDHIDGDGLNNRRSNLRVVTQHTNLWNRRSGAGGVSQIKGGRWRAYIDHDNRKVDIGKFETEREAKIARDAVVRAVRGPVGSLHYPDIVDEVDWNRVYPAARRLIDFRGPDHHGDKRERRDGMETD